MTAHACEAHGFLVPGEGLGGRVLAGFRQLPTSFLLSGVSPRLHCCGSPATVFSKVMVLRAFQSYPASITSCAWTLRIVMAAIYPTDPMV